MSYPMLHEACKRAVMSLSNMSNPDLDLIMNDDEKIENILVSIDQPYLQEIQSEKDSLLASNNELAESNLNREPELVEGREKLQKLSEEAEELSNVVKAKADELKSKGGDNSMETTLALIRTAASEMEEESDTIAKKFLDEGSELDDFMEQFLERRKLMHLRLVKAEKLAKILARDPALNNIPNYINAPPVNINSNYFPGVPTNPISPSAVPYPLGPIGMPMPPPTGNYFQNHY